MHTKFHKLAEALKKGRYTVMNDTDHSDIMVALHPAQKYLDNVLRRMQHLPLFTIDPTAMELIDKEACGKALKAMYEADAIALPFPECVIELESGMHTNGRKWRDIGHCWTAQDGKSFYVHVYSYLEQSGDVAGIWPAVVHAVPQPDGRVQMTTTEMEDTTYHEGLDDLVKRLAPKLFRVTGRILSAALVLLFTKGMARERVVTPERMQKARLRSGKTAIPTYTHIKIGTVYDRSGKGHDYEKTGRKMPVHMRRAHNRHVAYGKGRTERKIMHFPAVLVNYHDESDIEDVVIKHYGVTR